MRVKSYHATSTEEAMSRIKRELGEDALILGTKQEMNGVRITAACAEAGPPRMDTYVEAIQDNNKTPYTPPQPSVHSNVQRRLENCFYSHGLPGDWAEKFIKDALASMQNDPYKALQASLARNLKFAPLSMPMKNLMLVGPPGSGKTLALAKLAAKLLMSGQKPVIITTDTLRAGGIAQIEHFTNAMKLPLITAEDPESLSDIISMQKPGTPVLIDTMAVNPYNRSEMVHLGHMIRSANIEAMLVMPAAGDPAEMEAHIAAFMGQGITRMISTRLDMCQRLGGLLYSAAQTGIALADSGAGPRVADGLSPMNQTKLARRLLGPDEQEQIT